VSITETAKEIFELAKNGASPDKLMGPLIKIREEALALQEKNLELEEKIRELERTQAIDENLEFDGSVYWQILPDHDKDGPYCQRCYDVNDKLIRLQSHFYVLKGKRVDSWRCAECKSSYDPPGN